MKLWDLEEIIEGSNGNASGAAEDSDSDKEDMDLDNDPKPSRGVLSGTFLKHFFSNLWNILISEVVLVQVPRGKQEVNQLRWTLELVSSQTCRFAWTNASVSYSLSFFDSDSFVKLHLYIITADHIQKKCISFILIFFDSDSYVCLCVFLELIKKKYEIIRQYISHKRKT